MTDEKDGVATRHMGTRQAAQRWADTWQKAWASHDVRAISALYAANAFFQSHPFRRPEPAHAYIERVFGEESSAEAEFAAPVVDGDRVIVEWQAHVHLKDGGEEKLVGVSVLRFDQQGLVTSQRDIWSNAD